jgi:diguanylate cyclase (GGDEF)-like protein/PAS domain S-box-containing protein
MKLNTKIIIYIVPVIIAGFIIFAVSIAYVIREHVITETESHLDGVSESLKSILLQTIADDTRNFLAIANNIKLTTGLNNYLQEQNLTAIQDVTNILQLALKYFYKARKINLIDQRGQIIASTDISIVNNKFDKSIFDIAKTDVSEDFFSLDKGILVNKIFGPITADGKFLGILEIELEQEYLLTALFSHPGTNQIGETILIRKKPWQNEYMYVYGLRSSSGITMLDQNEELSENNGFINYTKMQDGLSDSFIDLKGEESISSTEVIPGFEWNLIYFVPKKIAYGNLYNVQYYILFVLFITLALTSLFIFILSTIITKPINYLTGIMQRYRSTNVLEDFKVSGSQEITLLGDVLQETISSLDRGKIYLSQTLASISDAVINVDMTGKIKYLNNSASTLLGVSKNDLIDVKIDQYIHITSNDMDISLIDLINRTIKNERTSSLTKNVKAVNKKNESFEITLTITPILSTSIDSLHSCVISITDISEIVLLSEQIRFQSEHDLVTGLPNRRFFQATIGDLINEATSNESANFAIFFIDIGGLKLINETSGHFTGDKLLKEIATRLQSYSGSGMSLARLDGNELVAIVREFDSDDSLAAKANIIINLLIQPFVVDQHSYTISVNIGISQYPQNASTTQDLLLYADNAMFFAKKSKINSYKFYSQEINDTLMRSLWLKTELDKAIIGKKLEMYYQPQIDAKNNKIIGVESLMRWNHPTEGFISPEEFIDIAEKHNLINQLTETAVWQSYRDFDAMRAVGVFLDKMSINLSIKDFERLDLVQYLLEHANHFNIPMDHITLEVTESVFAVNSVWIVSILTQLKNLGFMIAMDDFGKGFSSLSLLAKLPIDTLKIDKYFVDDITTDNNKMNIAVTIIELAKQLNKKVLAEGVEDISQVQWLLDHGCYLFQGFYFAKPMPKDALIEFYKNFPGNN